MKHKLIADYELNMKEYSAYKTKQNKKNIVNIKNDSDF